MALALIVLMFEFPYHNSGLDQTGPMIAVTEPLLTPCRCACSMSRSNRGSARLTISGTLVDHQRIAGKPLRRQEACRGMPRRTMVLPRFVIEAFTALGHR